MRLNRRSYNSRRRKKSTTLVFFPNFGGQGGSRDITFQDPDTKEWYWLEFSSYEEVRALVSQAHIVMTNWQEERVL